MLDLRLARRRRFKLRFFDVVGCQRFGGPCCLQIQGEDGGMLPLHYTVSQARRARLQKVQVELQSPFTAAGGDISGRLHEKLQLVTWGPARQGH
jgi:hypothetical protein